MRGLIARRPVSSQEGWGRRWRSGLIALALLVLMLSRLLPLGMIGGQQSVAPPMLLNPCTGEAITLRESNHLLPYVAPERDGSREVSVNAVGLSGLGSRGTYYLPLGTGKVVLTVANGTFDFVTGGDLALVGRGTPQQDFLFHSLLHLQVGVTSGLRGSGVTLQTQCGQ
jgi:hypothetical protein